MNSKKIAILLFAALLCASLCFAASAEMPEISSESAAETCSLSISTDNCFFVYAGTRDTVPNKLAKGTSFSFNLVFDPGKSSSQVTVYANGTEIPLEDGKYTYTINEDTVFEVITDGSRPSGGGKKLSLGEIMLIICGVATVGVVVWVVVSNKIEQKKTGVKKQ